MFRILPILLVFAISVSATVFSPRALAGGKKPAAGSDAAGTGQPDAKAVDISEVKKDLLVLSDGKKHYIAIIPFGDFYTHFYYGDGKRFYAQRVSGGGADGKEGWDRIFWEPRVKAPWQGGVGFAKGKYTVQCGDRATELHPLEAEEQTKLLEAASFFGPLWLHQAYSLARDNKGNYYFVDRLREPENNKSFRLYAGTRGNLKLLKMTNVVSDSQGDIFTTKKGELRLVLDRKKPTWFAGKAETELINLPLDDNRMMIYTDLGVYSGQRLGTPCDDLL
jgi:hypothetical protein